MRRIYIHQDTNWPNFTFDLIQLAPALLKVKGMQGRLMGRMESMGFELRAVAFLNTLTQDILKTSEIEGEFLDADQVRSSLARKLGMDLVGLVPSDRNVDGVVEMMLDATTNYASDLTENRLFGWHACLFPSGRSGMFKIQVGEWRSGEKGPMQVVSGPMGKEKIHFEAPSAELVELEMNRFLEWFNQNSEMDPVIKAGIAHVWFVTIHPFDDGNGRIARAVTDLQLARAEESGQRFYSMSAAIRKRRNEYYEILERTQQGSLDITPWLNWFLDCLLSALNDTDHLIGGVLKKAKFWQVHTQTGMNERQTFMINKLLEGEFFGNLTSSKWAKMTKVSQDTANRDIKDLLEQGVLVKGEAGGRSTVYKLPQLWV